VSITVVAHTDGTCAAVKCRYGPSFKQIICRGVVDLTARADWKRGQPELQMFYACSVLHGTAVLCNNNAVIVESFCDVHGQ
jgi:hypothetical protein